MRVALIDADILVYAAAHRCQTTIEWTPGEPEVHANLEEAQEDFQACITGIVHRTNADSAILALTDSNRAANFRRSVWPGYKATRETAKASPRPLLYSALREWIRGAFPVRQKPGIEADDTIGILATGNINGLPPIDDRVICSIDKDLLTVPGMHFNWNNPDEGVFYVSEAEANYHHMIQTLTGDSTDNYPGLPGVGEIRAKQILAPVATKSDAARWQAVVMAFQKKGLTMGDALAQARCARILQAEDWDFETNTVRLWMPPKEF